MKAIQLALRLSVMAGLACFLAVAQAAERVKDLARIDGWRDNQLIGYGLVMGLAGSGDTPKSQMTQQSIVNLLKRFQVNLGTGQISSRNVAAVMVTADLPPLSEPGTRIDVVVNSIGDARSLLGGTLLQTPLLGADGEVYLLAQGALSVGGYRYDSHGNVIQKNHPTVGRIPAGGIIERAVENVMIKNQSVDLLLVSPDIATAQRIATAINHALRRTLATPMTANRVRIRLDTATPSATMALLSRIEAVEVTSDHRARVVINERTGTVVAGGNVTLSPVTVVHGMLKISIQTDYLVTQPYPFSAPTPEIRTAIVPDTQVQVREKPAPSLTLKGHSSIADLVAALNKIDATPRDVIAVLQAIRTAGALHAELIIQ